MATAPAIEVELAPVTAAAKPAPGPEAPATAECAPESVAVEATFPVVAVAAAPVAPLLNASAAFPRDRPAPPLPVEMWVKLNPAPANAGALSANVQTKARSARFMV